MEYNFDKYLYEISCKYNLDEDEVTANNQYIKDCYVKDIGIVAFENAGYADNLFRKLDNISSQSLKNELRYRGETLYDFLSDVDTEDLESEIDGRWDQTFVNKHDLSVDELWELLANKGKYRYSTISKPNELKTVLCDLLGINTLYSKDEIIEILKEKMKYIS